MFILFQIKIWFQNRRTKWKREYLSEWEVWAHQNYYAMNGLYGGGAGSFPMPHNATGAPYFGNPSLDRASLLQNPLSSHMLSLGRPRVLSQPLPTGHCTSLQAQMNHELMRLEAQKDAVLQNHLHEASSQLNFSRFMPSIPSVPSFPSAFHAANLPLVPYYSSQVAGKTPSSQPLDFVSPQAKSPCSTLSDRSPPSSPREPSTSPLRPPPATSMSTDETPLTTPPSSSSTASSVVDAYTKLNTPPLFRSSITYPKSFNTNTKVFPNLVSNGSMFIRPFPFPSAPQLHAAPKKTLGAGPLGMSPSFSLLSSSLSPPTLPR